MANHVISMLILISLINVMTIFGNVAYENKESISLDFLTEYMQRETYETDIFTDEQWADNSQTNAQLDEATAGNSMVYGKSFWRTMLSGFKITTIDETMYSDPIEKVVAYLISWLQIILILTNGLLVFLVLKNKYSG